MAEISVNPEILDNCSRSSSTEALSGVASHIPYSFIFPVPWIPCERNYGSGRVTKQANRNSDPSVCVHAFHKAHRIPRLTSGWKRIIESIPLPTGTNSISESAPPSTIFFGSCYFRFKAPIQPTDAPLKSALWRRTRVGVSQTKNTSGATF